MAYDVQNTLVCRDIHQVCQYTYCYSYIQCSTSSSSSSTNPNAIKDDGTRRLEREVRKRTEHVGRLTRARESTLDYKMGITPEMKNSSLVASQGGRVNPVTMKGWASLVEDQIEVGFCCFLLVLGLAMTGTDDTASTV